MPTDLYSNLKALRHLDVVEAVRAGKPVRPVHVQIIVSDLCNQSCGFCAYRDPSYTSSQQFFEVDGQNLKRGLRRDSAHPERNYNPNRMIHFPKVVEILDDCRELGVEGIQYTGGGEPTVHPGFGAILKETIARKLPFAVVSNGVNIAARGYAPLIACGEWVRISLDAGTADTYTHTRHVGAEHWRAALQAIEQIRHHRDRHQTGCIIGVGYVVTPENWREVAVAARLVKELGADNIRISAQFSADDEKPFIPFAQECADLCREAESLGDLGFQVYNRFSAKLSDLRLKRPDYERCGYQHFTTYVGGDLNVYRCCVLAYNQAGLVGSIKERRFRDLWMGQDRADKMAAFRATDCARCQFNSINRPLAYVLAREPWLHEGFV